MKLPTTSPWSTLLCAAALLCALPATAGSPLVEMAVIDRETGASLHPVPHRQQHWIAGTPGHRYRVRLSNRSGQRVLVVLSVDGVNAVSGETADPAQAGYVLGPWQNADIDGWRKSHEHVAGFVFTGRDDSYAARTARPDHVGVIGIAVFDEQVPDRLALEHARPRHRPTPPPAVASGNRVAAAEAHGRDGARKATAAGDMATAEASAAPQRIGTGHGQREWAPVSSTHFVRASRRPVQVTQWRYDDVASLVARGVLPRYHDATPQAFPGGFVADPPARRHW